jgi:hypothetical protein
VGNAEQVRKQVKRASKKEYVVLKQQQLPTGRNEYENERKKGKKKKEIL